MNNTNSNDEGFGGSNGVTISIDGDHEKDPEDTANEQTIAQVRRCCGCCCDFRRAVLILDTILLIYTFLGLCYSLAAEEHVVRFSPPPGATNQDEDFPDEAWSDYVADSKLLKFSIVRGFFDVLIFLPLSIWGALRFQWTLIPPFILWSGLAGFISLIMTIRFCDDWGDTEAGQEMKENGDDWKCRPEPFVHIFNGVVWLVLMYPHVVLIQQYRSKRVTAETYGYQKACCTCCGR